MWSRCIRRKAKANDFFAEGKRLLDSQDYAEAERNFQGALALYKELYGLGHEDTLYSQYWLGIALYRQEKNPEAEKHLQHVLEGRKKILSSNHWDTLYS